MLSPVLNQTFKNNKVLCENYANSLAFNSENVQLITSPFKALKFSHFLSEEEYIKKLIEDVQNLEFHNKDNDLYSLKQSIDLNNIKVSTISSFIDFLKNKIQPLLSKVLDIQFNGKISVTASLYEVGDYLLCHDDKCEDRSVAFVYYLSGANSKSGGSFDMFNHGKNGQPSDIANTIPATYNSFLCFEVGNYTYHQVAEVTSKKFQRLSINGWFHSEKALSLKLLNYKDPMPELKQQTILEGLLMLHEFLKLSYCTPSNLIQVRSTFEDESQIMLSNFFNSKFYNACASALKDPNIIWKDIGPANRRRYEIAVSDSLPTSLDTLDNLLKSSLFASYIRNTSGLSIEPYLGDDQPSSKYLFEIQRWSPGCYSMATDNDEFFEKDGLDIYLFFNVKEALIEEENSSGYITYLASDGNSDDSELLTIVPKDNTLFMVYRTNDTVKFTKYINSFIKNSYYCICMTYFESM